MSHCSCAVFATSVVRFGAIVSIGVAVVAWWGGMNKFEIPPARDRGRGELWKSVINAYTTSRGETIQYMRHHRHYDMFGLSIVKYFIGGSGFPN